VPLLPAPPANVQGVHASTQLPSRLSEPDELDFSVIVTARDDLEGVRRCAEAVLRHSNGETFELIVVDNGSSDGTPDWLERLAQQDARVQPVRADHDLGTGAARNCGLRLARGKSVVIVDTSVEPTGDLLASIEGLLSDDSTGVAGAFGVNTENLRDFTDGEPPEVDAVEGYLMAFRRDRVREVGLMDEKFRFYRHLDLDYSFAFRARGYRNRIAPDLPLRRHPHTDWERTPPEERERLSKRNFYRFLKKYGHREDLLLANSATT
jgi:glycosyltransferase involved in cell wall biosynthesis